MLCQSNKGVQDQVSTMDDSNATYGPDIWETTLRDSLECTTGIQYRVTSEGCSNAKQNN